MLQHDESVARIYGVPTVCWVLGIYKGTCQARIPPCSWRETQNKQVELDVVGCLTMLSIREENKGEGEAVWGGGSQL